MENMHIVQKQVLTITLPDTKAFLKWEADIRHDFTKRINREMERCFDEYNQDGLHLIIDKLHLDLGTCTPDEVKTELPARLYKELQKQLQQRLSEAVNPVFSGNLKRYDFDKSNNDRHYFGEEGKLEILCFFLQKGYLPWYGSAIAQWDEDWLQTLAEKEITIFKDFLSAASAAPIRRLTTQFDDSFLQSLLQRFGVTIETAKTWEWLRKKGEVTKQERTVIALNNSFHNPSLNLALLRSTYWFDWIMYALGQGKVPSLSNMFRNQTGGFNLLYKFIKDSPFEGTNANLRREVPLIWKDELQILKEQAKEEQDVSGDQKRQVTEGKEGRQTDSDSDLLPPNLFSTENDAANRQELREDPKSTSNVKEDVNSKLKKTNEEEDGDALFVNDGGLILLHPFLVQLFENCAWVADKKFASVPAQTMAVYALHYLATRKLVALEHELIFPKLLAGIEFETPLEPVDPLNDSERDACDELLSEVIKHWRAIGNTSPSGLREAYLQRSGKLSHIHSGWHLNLEHKTLDILLNRLPWGISVVKLPWMPEMLTVTWQ